MNERECFIRRICEEPDDDTARLVFADWLDENGEEERAGDIRVGVDGPKSWIHHNRIQPVHRRYAFPRVGPEWITTDRLPDYCSFGTSHRGFLYSVALTCADFMTHAAAIFAAHPLTSVRLTCRSCESDPPAPDQPAYWFVHHKDDAGTLAGYRHHVPSEIGAFLWRDPERIGQASAMAPLFANTATAAAALSRACVAYGRSLADLPAWEPQKAQVTA